MIFSFKTEVNVEADYQKGNNHSTHVSTKFLLRVSGNLDKSVYLDNEGLPTKDGSEAITGCLIEGLIGNIHLAHQRDWRDSAEHLRYIIKRLEDGFAAVGHITEDVM